MHSDGESECRFVRNRYSDRDRRALGPVSSEGVRSSRSSNYLDASAESDRARVESRIRRRGLPETTMTKRPASRRRRALRYPSSLLSRFAPRAPRGRHRARSARNLRDTRLERKKVPPGEWCPMISREISQSVGLMLVKRPEIAREQRIDRIAEERPLAGHDQDVGRHARDELVPVELGELRGRNLDLRLVVRR